MHATQKDFASFKAKLQAHGSYERKSAQSGNDMGDVIGKIADGFDKFKQDQSNTIAELRGTIDRMETRFARPGALTGPSGGTPEIKQLITATGQKLPVLDREQKAAALFSRDASDDFSLGGYVRDAVVGSRKAASGPALVPTGLGSQLIDSVRANTVIVEAGSRTIIIDGPTNMARLTQDPTVYQHTEGDEDIDESDIMAEPVVLNPKLLAVLIPLTVELVSDSPNLDAVLTTALAGAFAAKLDALSIATLLADASIPGSAAAQDPATWAKVLEAVGSALALNQRLPNAHISAPADFIARASQLASNSGMWLGKPPALQSMAELHTTGLAAGTALFGDFAAGFSVALRNELRVEVVRHAKPKEASHLLVAHMRADGVVLQPGRLFKQRKTI